MPADWVLDPGLTSTESLEQLSKCRELLEARGLLATTDLRVECSNAADCWRGAEVPCESTAPRLPWVGADYHRTGVLVVAMNAHTHQGLLDESYCVEQSLAQLALGRQRFFGAGGESNSWFHYRAAAIAALFVADALATEPKVPRPEDSGAALLRSARIQAVQCSPSGDKRRAPTRIMMSKCPDHVLWPMVEALKPRTLVVLGRSVRVEVERRFDFKMKELSPLVFAGRIEIGNRPTRVVALRHPSSGFGMQSVGAAQALLSSGRL